METGTLAAVVLPIWAMPPKQITRRTAGSLLSGGSVLPRGATFRVVIIHWRLLYNFRELARYSIYKYLKKTGTGQ